MDGPSNEIARIEVPWPRKCDTIKIHSYSFLNMSNVMVKKVLRYVSRRRIIFFLRKENNDKQNNINRSFHRKVESPNKQNNIMRAFHRKVESPNQLYTEIK
jgi:hypothetical protein